MGGHHLVYLPKDPSEILVNKTNDSQFQYGGTHEQLRGGLVSQLVSLDIYPLVN